MRLLSLLPPVNCKKTGAGATSRESLKEALEKLVAYRKSGEGEAAILENPGTKQPYIIACGPNIKAINDFFLVFDGKLIATKSKNTVEAIDFLMKLSFVFNTEYEPCHSSFFKFLQYKIYNIECKIPNAVKALCAKVVLNEN